MLPGISPIMLGAVNDTGVPNPVDWPSISATSSGSTGLLLVSGFASPILIRAELVVVEVDRSAWLYTSNGDSVSIVNGATVDTLILPNSLVGFDVAVAAQGYALGTVRVRYKSPGSPTFDVVWDEFDFEVTGADI